MQRFARHLDVEFAAIFSCLFDPDMDATNWRAEQALRPAVITRHVCGGGNRTARGADTQHVLAGVLRAAQQRGLDTTDVFATFTPGADAHRLARVVPRGCLRPLTR